MGAFDHPYWAEPDYVSDGDEVALPVEQPSTRGKTKVIRCTVVAAAGKHARVKNTERGIERWVALSSLLVAPDDPRHPNNRCKP